MKAFSKFLEEWDLELIWAGLFAALCAIGLALVDEDFSRYLRPLRGLLLDPGL